MDIQATVLIIDDDADNIRVLASILQPEFRVQFATRARQGLAMLTSPNQIRPDLILLDVVMPELDGYDLCRKIKAMPGLKEIPVIFVTAKGEEQFESTGFEVGGVDYIAKPVKPFILLARVRVHVELQRQRDLLKRLSMVDGLTGLANRRNMDKFLEVEWNRAIRHCDSPLSMLMIDVDHFKRFNDGYGHQAGDVCLQQVAHALQDAVERSTDLVARYGGEEFACILPHTAMAGGVRLAQRIQQKINNLAIPHAFSDCASIVTISVGGISLVPCRDFKPEILIHKADEQLYRAKQNGRNRLEYCHM